MARLSVTACIAVMKTAQLPVKMNARRVRGRFLKIELNPIRSINFVGFSDDFIDVDVINSKTPSSPIDLNVGVSVGRVALLVTM